MPKKAGGEPFSPTISGIQDPHGQPETTPVYANIGPDTYVPAGGDVLPALPARVPSIVRLANRLSLNESLLSEFRSLMHDLKNPSFDYLGFESLFKRWQGLWNQLPDPKEAQNKQAWLVFLNRQQGRQLVEALLTLTHHVLTTRPNWGGVLIDCHQKMAALLPLLGLSSKEVVATQTRLQMAEVVNHVRIEYLVNANEPIRERAHSLIEPTFLEGEAGAINVFNLGWDLFRYSLGNETLERTFVRELLKLVSTDFERYGTILLGVLNQLSYLTERRTFAADNALTVRDYSSLFGLEKPFKLLASSTLFPSDIWTSVSAKGFLSRAREQDNWLGKSVLEIGTGKGILPLLLAEATDAREIDSVDINPDAPAIARLNTYYWMLQGGPKNTGNRVNYYHTANLDAGAPHGKKYDVLIGCIPQAPSTEGFISDRDKADVYPASDYPEDIDGFGLLALQLERGLNRLNPGGEILLTISGRPAHEAVVKMANLRGYAANLVVEEMILQHKGTDLSRYVEIEQMGVRLPFEFWVGDQKINATEAKRRLDEYNAKYLKASSKARLALEQNPYYAVKHKLTVMRFQPLRDFENEIRERAQERVKTILGETKRLGYFSETGTEYEPLGVLQAEYLTSLTSVKISPETLFFAPSLQQLIYNYVSSTTQVGASVYIDPAFKLYSNLKINLEKRFKIVPENKGASLALVALKGKSKKEILAMLKESQETSKPLFLMANPSSVNELNFVTEWLASHPEGARYVAVSWQNSHLPLVQPLATLILPNKQIYEAMQNIGKDTYSRLSLRALYEMGALAALKDLSGIKGDFARLPRAWPGTEYSIKTVSGSTTDLSPEARILNEYPAHPPRMNQAGLIDLSFGESEFEIPEVMLLKLKQALQVSDFISNEEVQQLVSDYLGRRSRVQIKSSDLVLGAGVHPLIQQTLQVLSWQEPNSSVLLPQGHYGQFPPTISLTGFTVAQVDLTGEQLIENLELAFQDADRQGHPPKAFLLQYPVNPSGLYYTRQQLEAIIQFCQKHHLFLLADEVFYEAGSGQTKASVMDFIAVDKYQNYLKDHLVVFGGTSKDIGWGMARFGYAYTANQSLAQKIQKTLLAPVDEPALRLAKLAYTHAFRQSYLTAHQAWLSDARAKFIAALTPFQNKGLIRFEQPEGGYFAEVDMSGILGRSLKVGHETIAVDSDGANLRQILKDKFELLVSPIGWAGSPHTMRLVYSVAHVDEALDRLKAFFMSIAYSSSPNKSVDQRPRHQGSVGGEQVSRHSMEPTAVVEQSVGNSDKPSGGFGPVNSLTDLRQAAAYWVWANSPSLTEGNLALKPSAELVFQPITEAANDDIEIDKPSLRLVTDEESEEEAAVQEGDCAKQFLDIPNGLLGSGAMLPSGLLPNLTPIM